MANIYIEKTLKMIKDEINHILNNDSFYTNYRGKVEVCDEQLFTKKKSLVPNSIYITVKFLTASFDFGQAVLPVSINAVSEQNGLEVCQRLLFDFATEYTQQSPIAGSSFPTTDYVKQIWNTPNIINNFNEINIGFRSLFYMTGTILIGHDSSPLIELVYHYTENGNAKTINLHNYMITFSDSFDVNPDTQPFYVTNGIGKSAAKTASYAFNITLFKVNNAFMNKCRYIKRGITTSAGVPEGISSKFSISMKDKDENSYFTQDYILVNMTVQQNKGDLPTVSLTFAR